MIEISTVTNYITPKEPCLLGGYSMRTKLSEGVLDELKCTAAVLNIDGEAVVFCDLEVLMLTKKTFDEIKTSVSDKFGVNRDFITISTIHTHAAPDMRFFDADANNPYSDKYIALVTEKAIETISECFQKGFCEVEASYFTVNIDGFYGNRNGIGKPEDKSVSVIRFCDKNEEVKAAMFNISCHPTVLGAENLFVSGDLLGYLSRKIEQKLGVFPVMLQGAAGDMSNRNYRKGHDAAELERTGEGIFSQIFVDEKYIKLNLSKPRADKYDYHTEYDLNVPEWEALRDKTKKQMEEATEYDQRKILLSGYTAINIKLKNPHIVVDFNTAILRLGDIEICKVPGEMFSRFGKQIKASSKAKLPLIWGYADGYAGYMPDEGEYGKTYESMLTPLPKGATEYITGKLCELIAKN
ncbi:MAG: hypothetical protein RSG78_00420 [Oscillospiraceae bacterium]